MATWQDKDGNLHIRMRNGDHYIMRGTHYQKLAS
jgi:hypothetical protein